MYAIIFAFILFFLLMFVTDKGKMGLIEGVTNPGTGQNDSATDQNDSATDQNDSATDQNDSADNADGLTYSSYSNNDPMILAQKNAANIEYLQERLKELQTLERNFTALKSEADGNKSAIKKMATAITTHFSRATGISTTGPPPKAVSGLHTISNDPENDVSNMTSN